MEHSRLDEANCCPDCRDSSPLSNVAPETVIFPLKPAALKPAAF